MGCLIAFRLCRSRVLALAVALLAFFVSQGWGDCYTEPYVLGNNHQPGFSKQYERSADPQRCTSACASRCGSGAYDTLLVTGGGSSAKYWTNCIGSQFRPPIGNNTYYCPNSIGVVAPAGYPTCLTSSGCGSTSWGSQGNVSRWDGTVYYLCSRYCTTRCESEEEACKAKGDIWDPSGSGCGKCNKNCKNRACCDSVAQNTPVKTDTTWEGCVSTGDNDRCVVYNVGVTPGDTTVSAICNGKSRYRVCTEQYLWSESAKQCATIMTNNCVNFDVADSNCTDVRCYATQRHALSSLDYDRSTQCYFGTETVQKMLICENGVAEDGGSYTRPWKVCQPYLDSIGTDISDYIAGRSGYSGTGFSPGGPAVGGGGSGGGGSGGGGSDPGYGGCVGNGCGTSDGMPPGYQGGPGVDAQGNEVENSPSPGIGGQYTPTPQIVTEYDSTTGKFEIVKNSSGGDSIAVNNVFTNIRCLGVSNGIATLTNGLNTWSCEAMSCSQATLSASINQGQCSPMANGVTHSETNPSMPTINYGSSSSTNVDWNSNEYEMLEQGLAMVTATLNAINADQKRHNDSLAYARNGYWKAVFGNDLGNVDSIRIRLGDVNTSVQGVENAVAGVGDAVTQNASTISNAVGNAATSVSTAVGNAASDVSGSVSAGATKVANAVNSASSNVSTAVGNAATSVAGSVDNMKSTLRDTLHRGNQIADGIYTAVSDTGRNIPTVIKSIDSQLGDLPSRLDSTFTVDMESWSNDKLKIMMDSNTVKVVDALDNLNVDVQLDSIHVEVPHDFVLDSIANALRTRADIAMEFSNDTVNLADAFKQGYDSVKADTSYDFDSSSLFPSHLYFVNGSAIQDTHSFASEAASIAAKFDSSRIAMNDESDRTVKAHTDSAMKYSGIQKGGNAMKQLFSRGADGCPRHCLDLSIQNPFGKSSKPVSIPFSTWLCDKKIFGQLSALDFIKHILRLMTSILSVMLIWSVFGKKGQK